MCGTPAVARRTTQSSRLWTSVRLVVYESLPQRAGPISNWPLGWTFDNLNGYTCIPIISKNNSPTTYHRDQLSYVVLWFGQTCQPRLTNWNEAQGLVCSQKGVALTVDLICSLFWPRPVVEQIGSQDCILSQKTKFWSLWKYAIAINHRYTYIREFASRSPKLQSLASQNGSWLGS